MPATLRRSSVNDALMKLALLDCKDGRSDQTLTHFHVAQAESSCSTLGMMISWLLFIVMISVTIYKTDVMITAMNGSIYTLCLHVTSP